MKSTKISLKTIIYKPSAQRTTLAVATALAFASTPKPSWPNPAGGQVVGGSATISTPSASSMVIDQTSNKAIINWNTFSIGAGESVRFNQPSASSVVLNRVLGNTRSEIFGSLTANGQIFLVNPNGVLMARGAEVSASGFLASSLGITDGDFLAGRYSFTRGAAAGFVINEGSILTPGGHTALLAPNIVNNGVIAARLGNVALAAGDRVTLDFHGDGLLRVTVDEATLTTAIKNSGTITADGGQVILTAKSANALLDTVLNNVGVIRADTLVDRNGVIALESSSGITSNTGSLLARGQNAAETGGTVSVTSPNVLLTSTAVADASGMAGGGNVFIGGNWRGQGPLANAQNTYVAQGAQLKADARDIGNGGEIVVWANNATRYYGEISARGGANGGRGGNAEVSGGRYLDFQGTTDLRASQGQPGSLLLDPANITINANADTPVVCAPFCPDVFLYSTDNSTLNVATLVNALGNASVVVDAAGSPAPTAEGKIIVDAPILTNVSAGTVLTLKAQTSITLNKSIALGAGTLELISGGGGLIQQTAGAGGITANTLNIINVNNSATLNEANNVANLGVVSLGAGVLTLNNATGLTVSGAVTGAGANLTTAGPLSIANTIDVGSGTINLTTSGASPITQSGSGALVANAGNLTVNTANSAVTLTPQSAAVNDVGTLNNVNTGNGAFTYTGNGSQNTLTVSGGTAGSLTVTNNNTASITGVINVVNDIEVRSISKNVNATPALVISTAGGITIRANEDISLQGQLKAQDATKGNITLISDSKSITLAKDFSIGNTLTVQAGPGQTLELAKIVTNSITKQIGAKNVSLIADTIDFTNFTSATGTGTLSIAPRTAGNPMDIGTVGVATVGALTLNQNTLNTMTSFGTIDLGRTGSLALPASTGTAGAINVGSANITNANLNLFSNGSDNTKNSITQSGALLLGGGAGTLGVITAGGNVSLPDSGNTVGTLGVVNTGKGVFNFNDSAGGLVVTGPVSVTGLAITTKDGDLQIKGAIADSGNSSLTNTTDSIIQTAGAPITNSDLTINAAKAITLTDTNNNLKGEVKITNTGANIVAITNSGGLSLGTSSVGTGTLTLTALGGDITQSSSSAGFKQTSGASAATFNAGTGVNANNITLDKTGNNFAGQVNLIGRNIVFHSDPGTKLTVTLSTTGSASIKADPNIEGAVGTDLAVDAVGTATNFGPNLATTVGGNLSLTNTDTVTQSAGKSVQVAGTTLIDGTAKNAAITLNDTANRFTGAATFKGSTIQVIDSGALDATLQATDASILKAGSNLSVMGTAKSLTTTTTGGGDTTATALTVTGGDLTVFSAGKTIIGAGPTIVNGNVTLNTTGDVSQNGVASQLILSGGELSIFGAGGGNPNVTLGSTLNTVGKVGGIALGTGSLTLNNVGGMTVAGAVTASGGITLITSGSLRFNNTLNAGAGNVSLATTGVGNAITQSPTGVITANTLALSTNNADTTLSGATHALTNLGATSLGSGALNVLDADGLTVTGVVAATGGITLNTSGPLAINNTLTTGAGNLSLNSSGTGNTITQNAVISGAGLTASTASGAIMLDKANNFTGVVNLNSGTTQITNANTLTLGTLASGSLTVVSTGALNLGQGTVTGNLTATSNGGPITQAATVGKNLTVTGTSTINAGANTITLTSAGNNFAGAVSLNNSGANNAAITNTNALILGASTVGSGTLNVTAGGAITQTGAVIQAPNGGAVSISAGANPITLTNAANDFTGTITATGTNVSLNDANALTAVVNSIGTNVINGGGPLNISGTLTNLSSTATIGGNSITATSSAPTFTVTGLTTNNGAANLTSNNLVIAGIGALGTGVLTTNGAAQTLQSGTITAGGYMLATGAMTLTGGSMTLAGPLTVSPATLLTGGATVVNGPAANVSGTFNLGGTASTTLTNTNVLAGGLLTGVGTLTGNINNSGTVAPGNSPGIINVLGDLKTNPPRKLKKEVGGTTAGAGYDRIAVTGNTVLDGTLNVLQFGGYLPVPPEHLQIITTTGTSTGAFTTVNRPPFAAFTALAVNYQSSFTELSFPIAQVPVPLDVIVGATAAPAGTATPLFITSDRGPACLVGDMELLFYPKGAPIAVPK